MRKKIKVSGLGDGNYLIIIPEMEARYNYRLFFSEVIKIFNNLFKNEKQITVDVLIKDRVYGRASKFEKSPLRPEEDFLSDFIRSNNVTNSIVDMLVAEDIPVEKDPTIIRESEDDRELFSDGGVDLRSCGYNLQVKWRSINFSSKKDFPYRTIFVDAEDQQDRIKKRIDFWVLTNNDYTSAIVVPKETRPHWNTANTYDPTRRRNRNFLECSLKHTLDMLDFINILRDKSGNSKTKISRSVGIKPGEMMCFPQRLMCQLQNLGWFILSYNVSDFNHSFRVSNKYIGGSS